jgi:hypothetical protein
LREQDRTERDEHRAMMSLRVGSAINLTLNTSRRGAVGTAGRKRETGVTADGVAWALIDATIGIQVECRRSLKEPGLEMRPDLRRCRLPRSRHNWTFASLPNLAGVSPPYASHGGAWPRGGRIQPRMPGANRSKISFRSYSRRYRPYQAAPPFSSDTLAEWSAAGSFVVCSYYSIWITQSAERRAWLGEPGRGPDRASHGKPASGASRRAL